MFYAEHFDKNDIRPAISRAWTWYDGYSLELWSARVQRQLSTASELKFCRAEILASQWKLDYYPSQYDALIPSCEIDYISQRSSGVQLNNYDQQNLIEFEFFLECGKIPPIIPWMSAALIYSHTTIGNKCCCIQQYRFKLLWDLLPDFIQNPGLYCSWRVAVIRISHSISEQSWLTIP